MYKYIAWVRLKGVNGKLGFTWLMLTFIIPLTAFILSLSTKASATTHKLIFNTKTSIIKQAANDVVFATSDCGGTTAVVRCTTSVTLQVDPNLPNYSWSTGATTPSITVNSSGLYWWQTIDYSHNMVANGDFTAGNTGFTSQYIYTDPTVATGPKGALDKEGYYTITTNPHNAHADFSSFRDHTRNTTGSRNMMVVNGATVAGVIVWQEEIKDIQPNTNYVFSIWFTSAISTNPGQLKFFINNAALNNNSITLTSGTPDWKNYSVIWNSGNSTTATIGITNENTIQNGNDFALDDVVFAPVCRKYINVTLSSSPPPDQPSVKFQ